jgi:hypothetical protein
MKMKADTNGPRGSGLVVALIMIAIVAAMGAATYMVLNNKYRVVHQAASWQESLLTAEAGVDMAMTEIRRQLYEDGTMFSGNGWTKNEDGSRSTSKRTLLRQGEGGTKSWTEVTVEWPEYLKDAGGEQWYRIVSHGYCEVSGGRSVAGASEDVKLRKLSLTYDRRAKIDGKEEAKVEHPVAHRVIDAIAKPQFVFRMALFGVKRIDLTDHNIVVDSYDSRDPNKSNWNAAAGAGTYPWIDPLDQKKGVDESKRQWNGDIGTNGTGLESEGDTEPKTVINAGNAHIFGTANTNGGEVKDFDNITGNFPNDPNKIRTDFSMAVPPVSAPEGGTQTTLPANLELQATSGDGTRIVIPTISLKGSDKLLIKGETGKQTYIEIVVTGDITVGGQGSIELEPGVHVRLFVKGDADIAGNGVTNPNSPLNLQIYGCDREMTEDGVVTDPGSIKIAGNGGFSGAIYAPTYDIEIKGGGASDTVYGSFAGYSVKMTGVQSVHYDEALGDGGLVNGYNIVSWFEDER